MKKRASGILLPVASLPTKYGIGGFSKEAYEFVDQLAKAGQRYWQILPLGPTGYGDSPYQAFSTFAGNPYYIALDTLKEEGLLTAEECEAADCGQYPGYVDYGRVYETRFTALRKAFDRFKAAGCPEEFKRFCRENSEWLDDYSLYSVIKNANGGRGWDEWPDDLRNREPDALAAAREEYAEEIDFYRFMQYKFTEQWNKLRAYANSKNIGIIGDIPIYVAMDSSDAWSEPELFQFDEDNRPKAVAGCPPDAFAVTGQLWGNPLYDWEYHKKTGYAWWVRRMRQCNKLYDVVRVDHFRGFAGYYAIPYGEETAVNGHWEKGPGIDLFVTLKKELGKLNCIAEDLGFLTDDVRTMVKKSGYPGMKILEFAFYSDSSDPYLPHNYDKNCVVYTGTHDNETVVGWFGNLPKKNRDMVLRYLGKTVPKKKSIPKGISWDIIRLGMVSVADLCVIPMQDYLELGNEARYNFPSTLGTNWKWRILPGQITDDLLDRIYTMTEVSGRLAD